MTKDIHPNKLNQRDRRRMENIRDRLRSQNVGEDEATRLVMEQVVDSTRRRHANGIPRPRKQTEEGHRLISAPAVRHAHDASPLQFRSPRMSST